MAKTYTTVDGDMWDSIAYRQLGSCSYTDRLMMLNQAHIRTFIFPAGVVITLPDVQTKPVTPMPPWKKVNK
jgi:phage tail protein X